MLAAMNEATYKILLERHLLSHPDSNIPLLEEVMQDQNFTDCNSRGHHAGNPFLPKGILLVVQLASENSN